MAKTKVHVEKKLLQQRIKELEYQQLRETAWKLADYAVETVCYLTHPRETAKFQELGSVKVPTYDNKGTYFTHDIGVFYQNLSLGNSLIRGEITEEILSVIKKHLPLLNPADAE